MRRFALATLVVAVVFPWVVFAQAKPDFSGTWTLDAARSDPPPAGRGGRGGAGGPGGAGRGPGGGGPITITQSATEITIGMATYALDGSPTTIEGRGGQATAKARWEGATLVVETSRDIQGLSITTIEGRSLSGDGNEMTVTTTTATPQGELSRKTIFTKS